MSPKRQRLLFVCVSVVFICVAALMMMQAFRSNVVFFRTPSELAADASLAGVGVRVGGLVETGSVSQPEPGLHRFTLTDGASSLTVEYRGLLPGLFREGQGIVAEGALQPGGLFKAERVLAKHDENYMPREVVDALKKSGHWHELPPAARAP